MTSIDLDLEISALRHRRHGPSLKAWLRRHRPFDRRAIRNPDERDAYWARIRERLAESDAESLLRFRADGPPPRPTPESQLVG